MFTGTRTRYRELIRQGLPRRVAASLSLWRPLPGFAWVTYDILMAVVVVTSLDVVVLFALLLSVLAMLRGAPAGVLPHLWYPAWGVAIAAEAIWWRVGRFLAQCELPIPNLYAPRMSCDSDFAELSVCMNTHPWLADFLVDRGYADTRRMRGWQAGTVGWLVEACKVSDNLARIKSAGFDPNARVRGEQIEPLPALADVTAHLHERQMAQAQAERLAAVDAPVRTRARA